MTVIAQPTAQRNTNIKLKNKWKKADFDGFLRSFRFIKPYFGQETPCLRLRSLAVIGFLSSQLFPILNWINQVVLLGSFDKIIFSRWCRKCLCSSMTSCWISADHRVRKFFRKIFCNLPYVLNFTMQFIIFYGKNSFKFNNKTTTIIILLKILFKLKKRTPNLLF